jgi:hypothetical protein
MASKASGVIEIEIMLRRQPIAMETSAPRPRAPMSPEYPRRRPVSRFRNHRVSTFRGLPALPLCRIAVHAMLFLLPAPR